MIIVSSLRSALNTGCRSPPLPNKEKGTKYIESLKDLTIWGLYHEYFNVVHGMRCTWERPTDRTLNLSNLILIHNEISEREKAGRLGDEDTLEDYT